MKNRSHAEIMLTSFQAKGSIILFRFLLQWCCLTGFCRHGEDAILSLACLLFTSAACICVCIITYTGTQYTQQCVHVPVYVSIGVQKAAVLLRSFFSPALSWTKATSPRSFFIGAQDAPQTAPCGEVGRIPDTCFGALTKQRASKGLKYL